jgi:hypothetical protein
MGTSQTKQNLDWPMGKRVKVKAREPTAADHSQDGGGKTHNHGKWEREMPLDIPADKQISLQVRHIYTRFYK